jgi:hypothetical protein
MLKDIDGFLLIFLCIVKFWVAGIISKAEYIMPSEIILVKAQKNMVNFGGKSCFSGIEDLPKMVDMNSNCTACCKVILFIFTRNRFSYF